MANEIHVELLLGRQVLANDGRAVGRIEEICAEERNGELVVTEYRLGAYAALERLSVSPLFRPLLNAFRLRSAYRLPWDKLDLTEVDRPTLKCSPRELKAVRAKK